MSIGFLSRFIAVAVFALGLAQSSSADTIRVTLEFEPDLENGKEIFEVCASCHLPEGWGHSDGTYPQLAGQHQNVLMQQLLDIRSGKRINNIMYPYVQERTIGGYQSLADVVGYISTLPMTPNHGRGPWKPGSPEYEAGKNTYQRICAGCHGEKAEGSDTAGFPKLQGQHFNYLKNQTSMIKSGRRESNVMGPIIHPLTQETVAEILNYISYIELPTTVADTASPSASSAEAEKQ